MAKIEVISEEGKALEVPIGEPFLTRTGERAMRVANRPALDALHTDDTALPTALLFSALAMRGGVRVMTERMLHDRVAQLSASEKEWPLTIEALNRGIEQIKKSGLAPEGTIPQSQRMRPMPVN